MADNGSQGRARKKSKGTAAGLCSKKQEARKNYNNIGQKQKKSQRWQKTHTEEGEIKRRCEILWSKCLKMKKHQNRTISSSLSRRRTELPEKQFN